MQTLARWALGTLILTIAGCDAAGDTPAEEWTGGDEALEVASVTEAPGDPGDEPSTAGDFEIEDGVLQLHFLYVHGVKGCQDDRLSSEGSLNELQGSHRRRAAGVGRRLRGRSSRGNGGDEQRARQRVHGHAVGGPSLGLAQPAQHGRLGGR